MLDIDCCSRCENETRRDEQGRERRGQTIDGLRVDIGYIGYIICAICAFIGCAFIGCALIGYALLDMLTGDVNLD